MARCKGDMVGNNLVAENRITVGDYEDYMPWPYTKMVNAADQNISAATNTDITGFTGIEFPGPGPANKGQDYLITVNFTIVKTGNGIVTFTYYMGDDGDKTDIAWQTFIEYIANAETRNISYSFQMNNTGEKFGFSILTAAGTTAVIKGTSPNLAVGYVLQITPRTAA